MPTAVFEAIVCSALLKPHLQEPKLGAAMSSWKLSHASLSADAAAAAARGGGGWLLGADGLKWAKEAARDVTDSAGCGLNEGARANDLAACSSLAWPHLQSPNRAAVMSSL